MRVFSVVFGGVLLALVALPILAPLPDIDLFKSDRPDTVIAVDLDRAHSSALFELKLAHVNRVERYDLGLFGNSRAVMVGCGDLGDCSQGKFFNFSVPGTSLRDWIMMIDRLRGMGKLPSTVILSIDNFALEYQSASTFPWMQDRFLAFRRDLIGKGLQPQSSLRIAWRLLYSEWMLLRARLSYESVWQKVALYLDLNGFAGASYCSDGSRIVAKTNVASTDFSVAQAANIDTVTLHNDLAMLAALRDNAAPLRLAIYESPLHPASHVGSSRAPALRAAFIESCYSLNLMCKAAPTLAADGWSDASHPPRTAMGQWLKENMLEQGTPAP